MGMVARTCTCAHTQLYSQHRGREIPGTHWPAHLAYLVSSRPMRDPVSNNMMASTCVYILTNTYIITAVVRIKHWI